MPPVHPPGYAPVSSPAFEPASHFQTTQIKTRNKENFCQIKKVGIEKSN